MNPAPQTVPSPPNVLCASYELVGSDDSAEASAVFISLIASSGLLGLNPEEYLTELFRVLPVWPQTRLLELHPRFWAWTRARLIPQEFSSLYGPITIPERVPLPSITQNHAEESDS